MADDVDAAQHPVEAGRIQEIELFDAIRRFDGAVCLREHPVDADDLVPTPFGDQVGDVRADEPGSTGEEYAHALILAAHARPVGRALGDVTDSSQSLRVRPATRL